MAYLLDTNACIQILNSPNSLVAQKTLLIPSRENTGTKRAKMVVNAGKTA